LYGSGILFKKEGFNMKRKTVGKLSTDLLQKAPDTRDPIELERSMHKDYIDNIYACCNRGKKDIIGDFFIVVETKKERLLENVIRNYFFPRISCPTPNYDQTVYRYTLQNDHIDFLWTIPSKDTCELFRNNILEIAPEEKQLLQFVMDFYDGTLLKLAKKLNNEKSDSPLLDK
jgi:hypothetical protein